MPCWLDLKTSLLLNWFSHIEMPSLKTKCTICMCELPNEIVPSQQATYKEFLVSMAVLTNSFWRPDVKSKWVKIYLIMVPTLRKSCHLSLLFSHLLCSSITFMTCLFYSSVWFNCSIFEIEGLFLPQQRGICSCVRASSQGESGPCLWADNVNSVKSTT